MVRLKLNLLQCFMCLLLLWLGMVHSFPSSNLALNNRYERDTSESTTLLPTTTPSAEEPKAEETTPNAATTTPEIGITDALNFTSETEIPENGTFELILNHHEADYFEFQVCCNRNDGCKDENLKFCFPSPQPTQTVRENGCMKPGMCAYDINFHGLTADNKTIVYLFGTPFTTPFKCFNGKITTSVDMYANDVKEIGCPLKIDSKKRFNIKIWNGSIPDGVTVIATNAKQYVEPITTTLPPTTSPSTTEPPTAETTNTDLLQSSTPSMAVAAALKQENEKTSDTLLYILIGVGILVFILIAGGIAFAIYWFCFKKKKSSKPVPPDTVPKTADAADTTTPVTKESPIVKDQTFESKAENDTTKDVERSKLAQLNSKSTAETFYWFCFKKKKSSKPVPPDTVPKAAAADTTPVTKETPIVKDKTKESKAENETKNVERSKLASSNLKTDASKLKSENPFDDETGHGGKSMSKKSQK